MSEIGTMRQGNGGVGKRGKERYEKKAREWWEGIMMTGREIANER